eukprot:3934305-Rhodomonas_salina.4
MARPDHVGHCKEAHCHLHSCLRQAVMLHHKVRAAHKRHARVPCTHPSSATSSSAPSSAPACSASSVIATGISIIVAACMRTITAARPCLLPQLPQAPPSCCVSPRVHVRAPTLAASTAFFPPSAIAGRLLRVQQLVSSARQPVCPRANAFVSLLSHPEQWQQAGVPRGKHSRERRGAAGRIKAGEDGKFGEREVWVWRDRVKARRSGSVGSRRGGGHEQGVLEVEESSALSRGELREGRGGGRSPHIDDEDQ